MKIDQERCIGCGQCLPYCPVKAISMDADLAEIDFDECVECGSCLRMSACPGDTIYQQEMEWPRIIRSVLSNPLTVAVESGIPGRGTEEMKTNEVTGRFKLGQVGIGIEVGRPITGTRLYDVEKVAQAVAGLGVEFEKINPTTSLMSDTRTGKFKDEILNEKVLSAILEFSLKIERLPEIFPVLKKVAGQIDSVFSLVVATRIHPDGSVPTAPYIAASGLWIAPNGKTNVGLGRPLIKED
ncbi:MAG: 4Fe-4S binding protein [Desulfobacterales bacterium]|nr:4Fe-4S binding protein [Desulfobacterales bacterium]